MLKRLRCTLFLCLIAISVLSFSVFIACNNQKIEIEFKTSEVVYRVGDSIDFYDFIVEQTGVSYKFTVTDSESNSTEIFDRTMYASKSGEYTLTCKASLGKKSEEKSTTFNIFDTPPFMLIGGEKSYNYQQTLPLDQLVPYDLMFVKTESSIEYVIDKVTVFANSYVYNAYCIDNSVELDENSKKTYDLTGGANDVYDGTYIKFAYEGIYQFHIIAVNDGGQYDSNFIVRVKENVSGYSFSELEENNLEYDYYSSDYASWDVVDGASKYRVKVDFENVTIDPSNDDRTNSYIENNKVYFNVKKYLVSKYTKFQNFDLIVFPLDASGKNITVPGLSPAGKTIQAKTKITLKDVVIAPEQQKYAVLSSGTRVSFDNQGTATAQLFGTKSNSTSWTGVNKMNNNYIAYKGNFGAGTYVRFTFVGNNIPNVCFFADEINGDMSKGSDSEISMQKGMLLLHGLYANYAAGSYKVYYGDRVSVWGPYRMNGGSDGTQWDGLLTTVKDCPELTQAYLEEDASGDKYEYIVGTYLEGNSVCFDVRLNNLTKNTNICAVHIPTPVDYRNFLDEFGNIVSGNIIAYATVKTDAKDSEFTFGTPYKDAPDFGEVEICNSERSDLDVTYSLAQKELKPNDGGDYEVTLKGNEVNGVGYLYQIGKLNNSYISFEGDYPVGTFVEFEFTGNNMPQVVFFANKSTTKMTNLTNITETIDRINNKTIVDVKKWDNEGLCLTNGFVIKGATSSTENHGGKNTFKIWGPNRIYLESDGEPVIKGPVAPNNPNAFLPYTSFEALFNYKATDSAYEIFTQDGLNKNGDKTFIYNVGTLNVQGKLYIQAILTDKNTEEIVGSIYVNTGLDATEYSGKILAYATVKGVGKDTTFKITETPYYYGDMSGLMEGQGALFIDGKVVLQGAELVGAGHVGQVADIKNNYVALDGTYSEYGVGTYIDFEFTGNNMPQVMFFADTINGNMTGYTSFKDAQSSGARGLLATNGFVLDEKMRVR